MTTTKSGSGTASRSALSTRTRALFLVLVPLLATVPAIGLVVTAGGEAEAHGTPMKPGSRTFLCRQDALTDTGEIKPVNPACRTAAQVGGTTPFYNWFSVLRSDGAGRTRGFVPDGELCSGGNANFTGFDPTRPLTRADVEEQPFLTVDHPPLNGSPGTVGADYHWSGRLPEDKSGRHIVYMVWQRSDSQETFHSCSDVVIGAAHTSLQPSSSGLSHSSWRRTCTASPPSCPLKG